MRARKTGSQSYRRKRNPLGANELDKVVLINCNGRNLLSKQSVNTAAHRPLSGYADEDQKPSWDVAVAIGSSFCSLSRQYGNSIPLREHNKPLTIIVTKDGRTRRSFITRLVTHADDLMAQSRWHPLTATVSPRDCGDVGIHFGSKVI